MKLPERQRCAPHDTVPFIDPAKLSGEWAASTGVRALNPRITCSRNLDTSSGDGGLVGSYDDPDDGVGTAGAESAAGVVTGAGGGGDEAPGSTTSSGAREQLPEQLPRTIPRDTSAIIAVASQRSRGPDARLLWTSTTRRIVRACSTWVIEGGHDNALDPKGNAVLTGAFTPTIDLGCGPMTAAGQVDLFVAKQAP